MTGLLLKDICTLKKQLKLYFLICLIIAVAAGWNTEASGFISVYIPVFISVLPGTALAYDEQSKWDTMAAMMPYSIRQLVVSKYLLGLLCFVAGALLLCVQRLVAGTLFTAETASVFCTALLTVLLLQALTLPMSIRFGVEKGRILLMAVVALGVVALYSFEKIQGIPEYPEDPGAAPFLIPLLAVALLYLASIAVSIRFYRKRHSA